MKLLSIDASCATGSAALLEGRGSVVWSEDFRCGRHEGGEIFSIVERAGKEHGPVERILVGLGPGSYSGIRQAIALAQGLRLAWTCELAGVTSTCGFSDEPLYQVFGDARGGSFYYTRVENHFPADGPRLVGTAEVRGLLLEHCPSYSAEPLVDFPNLEIRTPSASLLGCAALQNWEVIKYMPVEPFYLREPNITSATNPPRLREVS